MIVILESPYAGDVLANLTYARACLRALLLRGDAPYASHLLYTQEGVLEDGKPEERTIGMHAGFVYYAVAAECAVCLDRGVSGGMRQGIQRAMRLGIPIRYYHLDPEGRLRPAAGDEFGVVE